VCDLGPANCAIQTGFCVRVRFWPVNERQGGARRRGLQASDVQRAALYEAVQVTATFDPNANEVRIGLDPVASTACRRGDLNPHVLADTSPSSCPNASDTSMTCGYVQWSSGPSRAFFTVRNRSCPNLCPKGTPESPPLILISLVFASVGLVSTPLWTLPFCRHCFVAMD
jgi:hypothetical protein